MEARWPGSTHDSFILNHSNVNQFYTRTLNTIDKGIILGDSGYPLKNWLMTPFAAPTTAQQRSFNRSHRSTRATIERSFGLLKRRFPILQGVMRTNPERACTYIGTACILHNIAVMLNDPPFEGIDDDLDDNHLIYPNNDINQNSGRIIREHIANTYF